MNRKERQIVSDIVSYLMVREIKLPLENIDDLISIFDPELSQATFSFILPIRQLALYLIERFLYLPQIIEIYEKRTSITQNIRSILEPEIEGFDDKALSKLVISAFDKYYFPRSKIGKIDQLFTYTMTFLHFFLQLANSIRRGAEITYVLLYEYTNKMETMLKLEERANYVITKVIEGVEYIQLVFDSSYKEDLLSRLPYQFMKPKIGMVISSKEEINDFDNELFDPEYLFIVAKDYKFSKKTKNAHFVQYDTHDFWSLYSLPTNEYFFVKKIMY